MRIFASFTSMRRKPFHVVGRGFTPDTYEHRDRFISKTICSETAPDLKNSEIIVKNGSRGRTRTIKFNSYCRYLQIFVAFGSDVDLYKPLGAV